MSFDHHLSELSSSAPCIPSGEEFHFYYKFGEFRRPIEEIARRTQSMLDRIGSAEHIWGRGAAFPADIDDAYDWLVDVNDDVLELVDELVDELRRVKMEEEDFENEFGSGYGKRKREWFDLIDEFDEETLGTKPKVPFHIPTIKKPQFAYNIVVSNANEPFEHVLLEKSEDGQRFIHPLEKLSALDFVDKENLENLEPVKPLSIESTPFKLIEDVNGLKELAAKLSSVKEFAVDLEHNQYRSFQGLTCLMQISTRTEDFIIDTLKLHDHVGPYLREVFKDPTKKKVMHGANRDIIWLQRDFGIYVSNLFDTGQASRVLKLERYSLQHLLQYFCSVTANKEYQNADWRIRPLPEVMIRYGREDTHYLLYIYDLMRTKLLTSSKESEGSDDLLVEVYKRSYDVCMQLYEKELLTEDSYLHIYGLRGAGFNAQQLAVVSALVKWRDTHARADDESPGYVLPNRLILEIAKQMPVITSNLRRLVGRSKLPYVERSLDIIVNIVRHSMQNASAFEEVALRLKEEHAASVSNTGPVQDGAEAPLPQTQNSNVGFAAKGSTGIENATCVNSSDNFRFSSELKEEYFLDRHNNGQVKIRSNCLTSDLPKGNGADVQVPDVALLGNSASEKKLDLDKRGKKEIKLEQISSSHSTLGGSEISKRAVKTQDAVSKTSDPKKPVSGSAGMVMVDSDSDLEDVVQNNLDSTNNLPGENKPMS